MLKERVYAELCYCYVMLFDETKTQKLRGFTITRQRTRQNWTEKICDDWMEHVWAESGPATSYNLCRCCCRRCVTTLTDHHMWMYVRMYLYARAFVNVYVCYSFFFFSCAAAMKARYEFLPTTFEMICCVWAQRNVICIYIHACEQRQRDRGREEEKTRET